MKRLFKQRLRRSVVISLKSGSSFSGLLYAVDAECVILRNAQALNANSKGENLPVDGELLLLRADLDFIQLP